MGISTSTGLTFPTGLSYQPVESIIDQIIEIFSGIDGSFYVISPEYLYQDSAGTTPVTADGDPVGYVEDLSGNGNHAIQTVTADRPIYKTDGTYKWLLFNGVNQVIGCPDYSAPLAQPNSQYTALDAIVPTGNETYTSSNNSSARNQLFYTSNRLSLFAGSVLTTAVQTAKPNDDVIFCLFNGSSSEMERNNTVLPMAAGTCGTHAQESSDLGGSSIGVYGNCKIYSYLFINKSLSAAEKELIYSYFTTTRPV